MVCSGCGRVKFARFACFIDQSGRDSLFRRNETRMRITKYGILSIGMTGDTGDPSFKSRNRTDEAPATQAVWRTSNEEAKNARKARSKGTKAKLK